MQEIVEKMVCSLGKLQACDGVRNLSLQNIDAQPTNDK